MRTFRIGAFWLRSPPLAALFDALSEISDTRVVGGAVRNTLLSQPLGDIDLATTAHPEAVTHTLRKADFTVHETGLSHGTVTVVSCGHAFEVTTLRRDTATDGRHATVEFTDDFAVDAQRRDFTMNALYVAPDGTGSDYVGGYEDCLARRVRFIGDPSARIVEDYLRILRFFRFHAVYGVGALDPDGLAAARDHRHGLRTLSAERVHQETKKLISAPGAPDVIDVIAREGFLDPFVPPPVDARAFRALVDAEVSCGRERSAVLGYAALVSFDPSRFAALADRLKFSRKDRERGLSALTAAGSLPAHSVLRARQLIYRHGSGTVSDGMMIALATGSDLSEAEPLLAEARRFQPPRFPVTGNDLLREGGVPGPELGERLRRLETLWLESDFSLDRETLLAHDRDQRTVRR